MAGGFQPSVEPLIPEHVRDLRVLVNEATGTIMGIQNPRTGNAQDFLPGPVKVTAGEVASPSQEMLDDVDVTYMLEVAPFTRYQSNGSTIVGVSNGGTGFFEKLGIGTGTIEANSIFDIDATVTGGVNAQMWVGPSAGGNGGRVGFRDQDGSLFGMVGWKQSTYEFEFYADGGAATLTLGAAGNRSQHFTNGGLIAFGVTAPTTALGQVHIEQTSDSGAIPALYLDQKDVSEQMMTFAATIGVGNAIEAVGAKTLTTTHFAKITIDGVGDRYMALGTIA